MGCIQSTLSVWGPLRRPREFVGPVFTYTSSSLGSLCPSCSYLILGSVQNLRHLDRRFLGGPLFFDRAPGRTGIFIGFWSRGAGKLLTASEGRPGFFFAFPQKGSKTPLLNVLGVFSQSLVCVSGQTKIWRGNPLYVPWPDFRVSGRLYHITFFHKFFL